jgi:hypothetical protein
MQQAVDMRSLRATEYVRDFARRLETHRDAPAARAFHDRAAVLGVTGV